jgi:hypothetical protein
MPGFNKTGPMGMGPRTGRGFGPCGLGLGWRKRFGAGRGLGRYFGYWNSPQTNQDQKKALSDYRKALEEELEDVKKEEVELSKDA